MSEQVNKKVDFSGMHLTLEQLGISTAPEDLAIISSGGEDFGSGSLIGQWGSKILQWFLCEEDYIKYNIDARENDEDEVPVPLYCVESGGYYNMYYESYDDAVSAFETLCPDKKERGYKPRSHWTFVSAVDSFLNVTNKEGLRERGDPAIRDVRVMFLSRGSKKYPLNQRHEYNFISLPAAVAAAADILGFDNVGYDLSELTAPDAKDGFSPEFFVSYCGNPEGGYEDCTLYRRRAKLWKSLGEDDPEMDVVKGGRTAKGKPHKKATGSGKLSQCLAIAQGKLSTPLWARLTDVANPCADKHGEYYGVSAITQIFFNEDHARQVATEELAARGQEANDGGGATKVVYPSIGENWAGYEEMFIEHLKKYDGKPAAAITGADDVCATVEEINTWREYIKENNL